MADETGDTKNLGLGVTFVASIAEFQGQLKTIREQLAQFKTDLEAMGKTGKEASEKLTSANKDAEKALTQVTAATKAATVATGEAAKAAENLATGMEKAKAAVSGAGGAASKAAVDYKGLNFETMNMVSHAKIHESILGNVVDKLKKASNEAQGYRKGLVDAGVASGSSAIEFNRLSSALLSNEKYLLSTADGTKKVRSELGAGALPADMKAVVEGVDRLKFAQATLAGEMYKTGGVILDGRSKFVELQKTIASLTATHGEAAMKYTDAANRLGSYGTTVKSITGELNSYNKMHGEAVAINKALTAETTKLNSVYGGPNGLANSTGKSRVEFDKMVGSLKTGTYSLDDFKNKSVEVENNVKRLNTSFVENQKGAKAFSDAVKELGVQSPKTAAYVGELTNKINSGNMLHAEGAKLVKAHGVEIAKAGATANSTSGFWANLTGHLVGGGAAAKAATDYFSRLGVAVASLAAWIPAALIIGGLTEAITSSIAAVKDYDQALKSLQAISGGTEAEVALLGKEMLRVSDTTKYSAAEIAKGAIFIAQAGFTAGESLQVIAAAAKGAQGTLEPLTVAADLLTTVLRAFHIDASESSRVMDMLAMAANKSKTDLEGMKVVFNYLGPAAYSAGVSLNETLGTLMALSNVGMRMSTIGTSLRQVFIGLENPSAKLKAALAALGMTVDDLSVKKMGGLEKVLQNLDKVIGGSLTNAVQFFHVRVGNAALVISQMNGHVAMMIKFTREYGASAAMAGTQTEGMANQIAMLGNQFQNFIIRMAEGGLTNVFKGIISAASGLISVVEYLVNNPFTNFIITTGVMYVALTTLLGILLKVGAAITAYFIGTTAEAVLVAMKTVGAVEVLSLTFARLIVGITSIGPVIATMVSNFVQWIVAITKGVAITDTLRLAWIGLSTTFTSTPIGLVIVGLTLLAAAIYTAVTSTEKQSKALQENTITYANNAQAAEKFAVKLRDLRAEQKTGVDNFDSYVAVLKNIIETFPEVTAELVKNKDSLEGQAVALDKVAVGYAKMNENAAKSAIADLVRQYNEAGVAVGVYSRTLSENRGLLEQSALAVVAIIPGIVSYIGSLLRIPGAANEATRAWTLLTSAWSNNTSVQLANDSAAKMEGTLNRQRELYPQVASIIINSSAKIRQSLIDMIPEGEMKKAALGAVAIQEAMVASLKVGQSQLVQHQIDTVAMMGSKWIEYYIRQDELGKGEVVEFASNAAKKVDAAMKAFEKQKLGDAANRAERIRLDEEAYSKMVEASTKHIETLLKLEDKLYEEQHAKRKASLEITLGLMDLEQKQIIADLGNRGLKESAYLAQKEITEKVYFEKNRLTIEANTAAELASLENIHQAKLAALKINKALVDDYQAKLAAVEAENALKQITIYKEQLAAYKTHISEKLTEFNRYKSEYDKTLKEIQKLEEEHKKVVAAADKKFIDDRLAAEKTYAKEIARINLESSKQTEDLEKLKRDARQLTMSASELARDKELEYNETLRKGYEALRASELSTDSITKKEQAKIAQDYFKEATGMVKEIAKENKNADGTIITSAEEAKSKRLGFYDQLQKASDATIAAFKAAAAAAAKETVETAEKQRAAAIAEFEERKRALMEELLAVKTASKENMDAVGVQIKAIMISYTDIVEKVAKAIEIKADATKAMEEIKKLTTFMEAGKAKGVYNVVIEFLGKASPEDVLSNVIAKVKGWITELQGLIEKGAKFVVKFSGFDVVDSLIAKMNALFAASNRTATFTTVYKTEGQAPSSIQTSTDNNYSSSNDTSGPNGPPYHAEGGIIGGTGNEDTVPAMLTPGEFVVKKSAVQTFGEGFLNMINRATSAILPKFASGGVVRGWSSFFTTSDGKGMLVHEELQPGDFSGWKTTNNPQEAPSSAFYKLWKKEMEQTPENAKKYKLANGNDLRSYQIRGVIPSLNLMMPHGLDYNRELFYKKIGYDPRMENPELWARLTGAGKAEGGSISGTGNTDSVPAMLTPGEFVIRKSAVQTFGEGFFHMVNNMRSFSMPKFNMGGMLQAFANGGPVKGNEVMTLNLQVGSATLPLSVVGNAPSMRQNIRAFEKELSRMRLSHA